MLFGPHPCDDPNHGKIVGPVDMVVLAIGTCMYTDTFPSVDGASQRQRCREVMTLDSPWWFQLFSMRCCDVWEDAFSVPGDKRGSCCKLFVYFARGAENIRVYRHAPIIGAPVRCQQISMGCWDVWEEALSVPGHMGVIVHIVGFVVVVVLVVYGIELIKGWDHALGGLKGLCTGFVAGNSFSSVIS